jgi:Swt1-like HEPN
MPDENLKKSIVTTQNKLQPFIDAMEDTRRRLQPMQDAIRLAEQSSGSSGIQKLLKNIDVLGGQSELLKDFERTKQMLLERFELPKLPEISRLLTEMRTYPVPEGVAALFKESDAIRDLQKTMADIYTPWLDIDEKMRSMTGFVELQSIGRALENIPTFDDSLVAALRFDLGDWRDSISWKPAIFEDWEARSDFYESLGFNKALTDFPGPAFEQGLDIAGLRRKPPTLVMLYGAPVPAAKKEELEEGMVRPHAAFDWLFNFETELRAFIDRKMTEAFGGDWAKHRLPNGLYDQWQEKKKKAVETGGPEMPLISYADFTDYERVICKGDNWRVVFTRFFGKPESVRESLQRLYPIRVCTMHARPITKEDELLLFVEVKRLGKAFIC